MFIFLHLLAIITQIIVLIESKEDFLFFSPKRDIVKINDYITLSCRSKNVDMKEFVLKRNGSIMAYKCSYYLTLPMNFSCGFSGGWYYLNATIYSVTWMYRGEYECIINKEINKVFLNVTVPPRVKMKIENIDYNPLVDSKNINKDNSKLRGSGLLNSPYDLRNLNIRSLEVSCTSNCSYPAVSYLWDVTVMMAGNKLPIMVKAISDEKTICKANDSIGMFASWSRVKIDCYEQKLTGVHMLECKVIDSYQGTHVSDKAYFYCPEWEFVSKSNRSRLISKKVQMKVTTGEMINIIVGCSIGVVLLVAGIVLICRHRSKDDLDRQYTMRQNSIDHSGYRV